MFGETLQTVPRFGDEDKPQIGDESSVPYRLLYPVEEAATLCGISPRSMWKLVLDEQIESRWTSGRRLVPIQAIVAYCDGLPTEKPEKPQDVAA